MTVAAMSVLLAVMAPACGTDRSPSPTPKVLEDCGAEQTQHGEDVNADGQECLFAAFQAGRPAAFISRSMTVQGAPIVGEWRGLGAGLVEIRNDFTRGALGSGRVEIQRCTDLLPIDEWNARTGASFGPEYVFGEDGCVATHQ